MAWLPYVLLALASFLLLRRLLPMKGLENLSAAEVQERLGKGQALFIDVREPQEFKQGHIRGFKNVPLSQLSRRITEMNKNREIVLTCRSGSRSRIAAKILRKNGFTRIAHLQGGLNAWQGPLVR